MTIHYHKATGIIPPLLLLLAAALLLAAWFVPGVADLYTANVFPLITGSFGRLTSLLPFSLGEWLLLAALVFLAALLIQTLFRLLPGPVRASMGYRRFYRAYLRAALWIASVTALIMVLNCFIQYHCTPLEESLQGYGRQYSTEDLAKLRDMIVEQANTLAEEVPETDFSRAVLHDPAAASRDAVAALASMYPRLGGYQVNPKPLYYSWFVSQQYMQGYYFPFSMEANYNDLMMPMNIPFTMCHEIAHTHGYILEDDANFLAFLACTESKEPVLRYSGYLGILYYVDNDFYASAGKTEYRRHLGISEKVRSDSRFLSEKAWAQVERLSPLPTKTVQAAADTYVDTTLKANGIASGKASYSHVVALLLEYYDGDYSGAKRHTHSSS